MEACLQHGNVGATVTAKAEAVSSSTAAAAAAQKPCEMHGIFLFL